MFETVAKEERCIWCSRGADGSPAVGTIDRVYVINTLHRQDRYQKSVQQLHDNGLCCLARVWRTEACQPGVKGCWDSHRAVAVHALADGLQRVLVLEDDAVIRTEIAWQAVKTQLAELPAGWDVFYLGHVPAAAIPLGRASLFRTFSGGTHAMVVSPFYMRAIAARPWQLGDPPIDVALMHQKRCYCGPTIWAFQDAASPGESEQRGVWHPTPFVLQIAALAPGLLETVGLWWWVAAVVLCLLVLAR